MSYFVSASGDIPCYHVVSMLKASYDANYGRRGLYRAIPRLLTV